MAQAWVRGMGMLGPLFGYFYFILFLKILFKLLLQKLMLYIFLEVIFKKKLWDESLGFNFFF
jgi:hypothetical protein